MGLFSVEKCCICGNDCNAITRTKLNNGEFICAKCCGKNFVEPLDTAFTRDLLKSMTKQEIEDRIEYVEKYISENKQRIENFSPTYKEGNLIWFDDKNKLFVLPKGSWVADTRNCNVFKYDEIIDFEVLEDGTTVTKGGLGKALVGGYIFGLAGAIAGGTSKKYKDICTQLELKITTTNKEYPVIYVSIIKQDTSFKKSSLIYRLGSKAVQNILSKLQIIINDMEKEYEISTNVSNANISAADEIKKYKELLDMGAISQEEYDKKKKELLGL